MYVLYNNDNTTTIWANTRSREAFLNLSSKEPVFSGHFVNLNYVHYSARQYALNQLNTNCTVIISDI